MFRTDRDGVDQVVVLAGGSGRRMLPLTETRPKALIELPDGSVLLDRVLEQFGALGVEKLLILTGYKHSCLTEYLKLPFSAARSFFSVQEDLFYPENWESGARLTAAYRDGMLGNRILVVYCDVIWTGDLRVHLSNWNKGREPVRMLGYTNRAGDGEYGSRNNLQVAKTGQVISYGDFSSKNNATDIGFVFLESETVLDAIRGFNPSWHLGRDILAPEISMGSVCATLSDRPYMFFTSPEDVQTVI